MFPRKNGYVRTTGFGEMKKTWHKNSSSLVTLHVSLAFSQLRAELAALPGEGYCEPLPLQAPRDVLVQLMIIFPLTLL